jgi:hypothetical protein
LAAHKAKQLARKAAIIVRPLGDQRGTTYGCISPARPAAKKGHAPANHREDCIGGQTTDLHVITHDPSVDLISYSPKRRPAAGTTIAETIKLCH